MLLHNYRTVAANPDYLGVNITPSMPILGARSPYGSQRALLLHSSLQQEFCTCPEATVSRTAWKCMTHPPQRHAKQGSGCSLALRSMPSAQQPLHAEGLHFPGPLTETRGAESCLLLEVNDALDGTVSGHDTHSFPHRHVSDLVAAPPTLASRPLSPGLARARLALKPPRQFIASGCQPPPNRCASKPAFARQGDQPQGRPLKLFSNQEGGTLPRQPPPLLEANGSASALPTRPLLQSQASASGVCCGGRVPYPV